jgi:quinol monooxygenase YgiN
MRIAHVTFTVAPENQNKALNALLAEVPVVRQMKGCLAFIPFVDPTVAGGLGVVHEWESDDAFAVYINSPGFKAVNDILRPLMTGAPVSRRFEVNMLDTVN